MLLYRLAVELDLTVGYSVSGTYRLLAWSIPHVHTPISDLIWHKDIHLKLSVFVWRLFKNMFPTKDNLFRRGIVNQDSQHCVSMCGA